MTAYNDRRFLREAVEAVLAQSFTDFEFVIVDNGSDDPTYYRALEARDARIRVIRLEQNMGPPGGGNAGIAAACAPIIARMDSDDVAAPEWLAQLMAAFREDPELGLAGTWVTLIDESGDCIGFDRPPTSDFAIRFTLLSHNPFYQSSLAFRRELFDLVGPYVDDFETHDHQLWHAMMPHCRARNVPEQLVRYRYTATGIGGTADVVVRRERTQHLRERLWQELGQAFPLVDDALGNAFADFLRVHPCHDSGQWPAVGNVAELAVAAVEARLGDFLRSGEEHVPAEFVAAMRERLRCGPIALPALVRRVVRAIRLRGPLQALRAALRGISRI